MKNTFACLFAMGTMLVSAHAADVTTKLTDVHLCCKSCVTLVQKTVADKVPDAKAVADQEEDTITITGSDTATVQKAADALVKAGYFGKSSNPDIKVNGETGAKDAKMASMDVSGVHLCCAKCVKAVTETVKKVPGVTGVTGVEKNAKTFQVTGDFNDKDVFAALQKAGLTGKEGAPEKD